MGRHGVPRPEPGVVDALLRVLPALQELPGHAQAVIPILLRRLRDGPLIPRPVQRHDLRILHPLSLLSIAPPARSFRRFTPIHPFRPRTLHAPQSFPPILPQKRKRTEKPSASLPDRSGVLWGKICLFPVIFQGKSGKHSLGGDDAQGKGACAGDGGGVGAGEGDLPGVQGGREALPCQGEDGVQAPVPPLGGGFRLRPGIPEILPVSVEIS